MGYEKISRFKDDYKVWAKAPEKKMELPVCKSNMFEALTFEMPIRNIK